MARSLSVSSFGPNSSLFRSASCALSFHAFSVPSSCGFIFIGPKIASSCEKLLSNKKFSSAALSQSTQRTWTSSPAILQSMTFHNSTIIRKAAILTNASSLRHLTRFSAPFSTSSSPSSSSSSSSSSSPSSSSSSSPSVSANSQPPAPLSRFRQLWHDYGAVGVGTYLSVYVSTLAVLYICVHHQIIPTHNIIEFLQNWGFEETLKNYDLKSKWADFIIAWITTKTTEPLRLAVTILVTPTIARWLGRAKPKEKLSASSAEQQKRQQ